MTQKISLEFLEKMKEIFQNQQEFENYLQACQIPLKKSLRINLSKIHPKNFIDITKKYGRTLTNPNFVQSKEIEEYLDKEIFLHKNINFFSDLRYVDRENTTTPLGKTFRHLCGFFYIQEISAGLPARFFNFKDEDLILDMAAAPGGKSIQLADYSKITGKNSFVIANDMNYKRVQVINSHINRMGFNNIGTTNLNGMEFGKKYPEMFDKILLDAPCSGEGTMFKNDFSLKYRKEKEIFKIANVQQQLLISAIKALKIGGELIYSTCTINPIENEKNVSEILKKYKGILELKEIKFLNKSFGLKNFKQNTLFEAQEEKKLVRLWPHIQKTGGFFIAKFQKISSISNQKYQQNINIKIRKNSQRKTNKNLQNMAKEFLQKNYGINIFPDFLFIFSADKVYLGHKKYLEIKDKIDFEKIGIHILKYDKHFNFRPTHYFGTSLGNFTQKNYIKLTPKGIEKYINRTEIDLNDKESITETNISNPPNNYIVLKFENYGIGVGKIINGKIKSKFDYKM